MSRIYNSCVANHSDTDIEHTKTDTEGYTQTEAGAEKLTHTQIIRDQDSERYAKNTLKNVE